MTEITHEQIRDLLPDALHGKLDAARQKQLADHLHSCAECASELRVLEKVKGAPSFAPMIDAVKVSSAIPPYGGVPKARTGDVRVRSRVWQLAVVAMAVAVVAGSYLSMASRSNIVATPQQKIASAPAAVLPSVAHQTPVAPAPVVAAIVGKPSRQLQVAAGLDDLSDGSIAQLASELDGLDGLPSPEPEHLGVSDPSAGVEGGQ